MERVEEPAFSPEDRIGALEMQNLSVGDNRSLLLHHLDSLRQLGANRGGASLSALLGEGEDPENGTGTSKGEAGAKGSETNRPK